VTYFYCLRAAGEVLPATALPSGRPVAPTVGVPRFLVGWHNGGSAVDLVWGEPEGGADGYYVFRASYEPMPDCNSYFEYIGTYIPQSRG